MTIRQIGFKADSTKAWWKYVVRIQSFMCVRDVRYNLSLIIKRIHANKWSVSK